MKIAVAGKGGAGKTFVSACLAYILSTNGQKTMAIDADSAPNLGSLLGLSPDKIDTLVPISKNEELISSKTNTGFPGVYSLNFSVDDVIQKYAVPTPSGVHLLIMGTVTAMGTGCSCPANSVIRALLRHLIVTSNEVVVLDMEAGLEHLGRGTAENVDVMLVVSDAHTSSLHIAGKILTMAENAGIQKTLLIGNRVTDSLQEKVIQDFAQKKGYNVAGMIPFDVAILNAGIAGEPIIGLTNSPAFKTVNDILETLKGEVS